MIDVENEIFASVANPLREKYENIFITGEYVKSPPSFPCVSIIEMDNVVYQKTGTTDVMENHAQLLYEINVYSNKTTGKKTEVKKIIKVIDKIFGQIGFTRIMSAPVPNEQDNSIYRMVSRYRAVVSTNKTIFRR
ncbi:MAG: hypothetical protein KH972_02585 [Peptostreptococcaceae bacterium]|nr:hypothetical protein [Peptostreptococcaceae bacterium]